LHRPVADPPDRGRSRPWAQAAAVFAAALLVRGLYLASIHGAIFFTHLTTEPLRYHRWAAAILGGSAHARPPFDEAPAYVYALAGLYAVCGRSVLAATIAQAVVDAASCVLIALLARRQAGPRAGLLAGALAAVYGPLVYFTGELVPASALVLAVAAALLATPTGASRPARWLGAGAAWSAALLVRSEVVLALPLVALHAARAGGRRALLGALGVPAVLLAASLAVNYASSRHVVVLTSGAGVNLWLGNNPDADGVNPFIHGPLAPVVDEIRSRARDSVEADEAFLRRGLAFIGAEPARAARLLARKLAWTWSDRELPNTSDIDWQTGQSWLFRPPWFPLRFGVIFPLALAGLVLLGRARKLSLLGFAPLAVGLGTCVVFLTNARFRIALVVTLLPLAAAALDEALRLARSARAHAPRLGLAAAAAVAGALLAFADVDGVRGYRIAQLDMNTGALERAAGHLAEAVPFLDAARRAEPDDPSTWVQLATTQEQAGQDDAAYATWVAAVERFPDDPTVRQLAARFFRRHPR
jgi:hypothetical protein